MIRRERKQQDDAEISPAADEDIIYRIDIPANRYDMMCLEGIARALNIFRGTQGPIKYRLADMRTGRGCGLRQQCHGGRVHVACISFHCCAGSNLQQMIVKPEAMLVRPFVVCAILRGVTLNKARYDSFIDLQVVVI